VLRLVQYPAMNNLTSVLKQLQQERTRLASQLENLNGAISALNGIGNPRTGRTVSAAGRARIAAAQRARWAKVKGKNVVSIARGGRRKMSAAAIARIRAAQKARWAKWRKVQKKA
jgi:NADPH-dependent curcumin reductase CurA